jgi:hypothetical protein
VYELDLTKTHFRIKGKDNCIWFVSKNLKEKIYYYSKYPKEKGIIIKYGSYKYVDVHNSNIEALFEHTGISNINDLKNCKNIIPENIKHINENPPKKVKINNLKKEEKFDRKKLMLENKAIVKNKLCKSCKFNKSNVSQIKNSCNIYKHKNECPNYTPIR